MVQRKERRQRLGNLRSACSTSKSSKILKHLNVKERSVLLKHIIVSDKYKFLYCYTPKVACSNWKRVVMVLDGVSDGFVKDHPHGLKYLYQYSSKEIDYRLKNYFKFTFVRNPLERLLSAYRNKFGEIEDIMRTYGVKIKKRYGKSGASQQEEYTGKIPGDDVSFEEFIRFLLDNSIVENMNEHWAPMHTLCQPCVVDYDFIGSYDNLYEDSEKVLQQIKAPKDLHFPTRQSYYSPSSLSTTAYYYSVVNNTYLESLFAKYYQDFALFSYPFPKIK
uniref:carbohydrate sulfotransferase 14-like n=1 Tax=Styela clava TaxID=7725 RepID=UPI00193A260B|nr:carbohydrate sulfotransferase 14-like [Styela clava]